MDNPDPSRISWGETDCLASPYSTQNCIFAGFPDSGSEFAEFGECNDFDGQTSCDACPIRTQFRWDSTDKSLEAEIKMGCVLTMNQSFCNECDTLVEARRIRRQRQIFLTKDCPTCGTTETLISGDADRYFAKRTFEGEPESGACQMNCLSCRHDCTPSTVFVDVTNRCNQNCPICINNTPTMGFVFDPPLDYFKKVFKHLSEITPRPSIQLFGGEPTVRKDLFEIIRLARSYGLVTRVVTNGLRLSDEEYCRELLEYNVPILFAYDGSNPRTYQVLRGSADILERKQKALDNLSRIPDANVTLLSMVAKGFNDQEIPTLLDLCHQHDTIRSLYFIPLAHTWDAQSSLPSTERITNEDVESLVADCFHEDHIDFIPAGVMGDTKHLMEMLCVKSLPFASAHPNCESQYLLVSTENGYVPISRFLKTSILEVLRSLRDLEKSLATKYERTGRKPNLILQRLLATSNVLSFVRRHLVTEKVVQGCGPGKVKHFLAMLFGFLAGKPLPDFLKGHSAIQRVLPLVVLPFEDRENLETERLERCPSAFAFYDPALQMVRFIPTCAWSHYKNECMRAIADYYAEIDKQTASLPIIPRNGTACCSTLVHI